VGTTLEAMDARSALPLDDPPEPFLIFSCPLIRSTHLLLPSYPVLSLLHYQLLLLLVLSITLPLSQVLGGGGIKEMSGNSSVEGIDVAIFVDSWCTCPSGVSFVLSCLGELQCSLQLQMGYARCG